MQMIPSWSTTGTYTTIIPLMVFISISMFREGYDDWRRHRQDKSENTRLVKVAKINSRFDSIVPIGSQETNESMTPSTRDISGPIRYEKTLWKDLRVGDIIKLQQNDWVPADIVVLHADGLGGMAYIETMALDGETNLKSREPLPDLAALCDTPQKMAHLQASVITEDPNLDLYNFEGKAIVDGKTLPLSNSHVVYRGSILRNTSSMHGLVIFSGEESKIRMNAIQNPRTKAPKLQKRVNGIVIFMVVFVLGLSVFCTVAAKVYFSTSGKNMWYLKGLEVGVVPNLMGFIIMFNTLIPLSLYVSMEIVKLVQMLYLQLDIDMYHEASNTPCEARTSSINEELGQVSYIFSDKTGTLTDNVMVFRKFSVAGHAWLHALDEEEEDSENLAADDRSHSTSYPVGGRPSRSSRLSRPSASRPSLGRPSTSSLARTTSWRSTANPSKPQVTHPTAELLDYLQTNPHTLYSRRAKFFLLSIALCHSCLPELKEGHDDVDPIDRDFSDLQYQAASPDELALVNAARQLGYMVIDRQHRTITIRSYPKGLDNDYIDETYEMLETIEFSSSRKRMSVVVKFPDGRICVFCKGADNVILERLRQSSLALSKASEIARQSTIRKNAEAEIVMARNSMSSVGRKSTAGPRPSMGGPRPSMTLGGISRPSININPKDPISSLDNYLHNARTDEEVEVIAETSRKSMQLARQKKYGESPEQESTFSPSAPTAQTVRFSYDGVHSRKSRDIQSGTANVPVTAASVVIDDRLVLNDAYVMEKTLQHVEEFSTEGLRTLLYANRFMDKEEYDNWNKLYRDACTSLENRQEKIEKIGEMIERDFELCGATAIEDKLQAGVPETIDKLRRAGIKLWMLTGDKRETAINIGYSCRLIKDYSTVVILGSEDGDVAGKMAAAMLELDCGSVAHCVVVVDGFTLSIIEQDMTLMTLFIDLGVKSDSVICCRASPAQKSSMVMAMRKKVKNAVTLAIGDGANDIAMIQSADVGIGITGKEGLQAARSSDYSIAQFRFLQKLLLVQGRWNYVRTCKYILGTFYKELMFYLTQAVFQRNTMFTGSSLYETWSLSMFNTLFTSLPVICIGIFERDLDPATLIAVPELYLKGQKNQSFGLFIFLGWMIMAASQSVITSFAAYYLFGFQNPKDNSVYPLGMLAFTTVVVVICTKLQFLEMYSRTIVCVTVVVISVGGWFCWNMFLSFIYGRKPSKIYFVHDAIFESFGQDLSWWSTLFVMIIMCILFDIIITTCRVTFFNNDTDVFQELQHNRQVMERLEEEASNEIYIPERKRTRISSLATGATPSSTQLVPPTRKRDRVLKKLRFSDTRTSGEYEREIEEILERREREIQMEV